MQREAYAEILTVSPGMSGLSQLAFTRETEIIDPDDRLRDYVTRLFPQKLALDRLYARQRSLRMNVKILVWTTVAVAGRDVAVHRSTGRELNRCLAMAGGLETVFSLLFLAASFL